MTTMLNSNTVVLERLKDFTVGFETEPYEAGWAREAIFFLRVHSIAPGTVVRAHAQISVDGIEWIDEGAVLEPVTGEGTRFLKVAHFGGWLRLRVALEDGAPAARITIQLVLKS